MSSPLNSSTISSNKLSKVLALSPRQRGMIKKKKSSGHSQLQEVLETDYLDGPQVYSCTQCRTHLTSHDDIISKSFHGRHGRAYLFDHCVNVVIGSAEDRMLMTGLHSVNDIFCKRCKTLIGWTYSRAYEQSQKYKEGKFIIEKIHLYLEGNDYDTPTPAGEKQDRWRKRSMSWGSDASMEIIYEYKPCSPSSPTFHQMPLAKSSQSPHYPPSRLDL